MSNIAIKVANDYNENMLASGIKITFLVFLAALISAFAIKIIYINLTPGVYVKYGCCNYGYLTRGGIEKEKMKINICPKVRCNINEDRGYKLHMLFNKLDFN